MSDTVRSSPIGLLRCLEALAEEAANLNMPHTLASLREAVLACRLESGMPHSGGAAMPGSPLVH